MSAAGDLVTVLSLDEYEFVSGLREAAQETKQFAATTQQNLGKAGASGAALGRSVGQVGFALQDFSSILSMGGKNAMGRALMSTMNNVQMLGAAFGPWGMAVTAVGGALGSMLIPKLFEGAGAFDSISESTGYASGRLDAYIERTKTAIEFQAKLNDLQTGKQGEAASKDVALRTKESKASLDAMGAELKSITEKIRAAHKAGEATGGANSFLELGAIASPAATWARSEINDQIKQLEEQKKKLTEKFAGESAKYGQLLEQGKALEEKQPKLEAKDEQLEREKEINHELDARAALLDKLKEKAKSPAEHLQEQLTQIKKLTQAGELNPVDFDRLSEQYLKEYQQQLGKGDKAEGKNAGALAGTSQAYEAIRESIQAEQAGQKHGEEMEVARQQLEALRLIVKGISPDTPDEAINGHGMGF